MGHRFSQSFVLSDTQGGKALGVAVQLLKGLSLGQELINTNQTSESSISLRNNALSER